MIVGMGDFNTKIGQGTYEEFIGQHDLGKRNERDE